MASKRDGAEAEQAAALVLLDKLQSFASGLPPVERRILAALLAPGVEAAWADEPEVSGFAWSEARVPEHLADAIRRRDLRIQGW